MSAEPEQHSNEVLEWFARFSGVAVPNTRRSELETSVRRVMLANNFTSAAKMKDALLAGHKVVDTLVSELTVAETYFFRDSHHFDLIRQRIVPEFLRANPSDAVFRTWCAGCATGEEAYSLAILFNDIGLDHRSSILATDICRASLQKAARGSYGDWSFRSTAGEDAKKHFRHQGNRYLLDQKIRNCVSFQFGNLAAVPRTAAGGATGENMNLIMCRNVMIYFDQPAIVRLAEVLFNALTPGGWLIVGPSDPPLWDFAPFEVMSIDGGLYYRRPEKLSATGIQNAIFASSSSTAQGNRVEVRARSQNHESPPARPATSFRANYAHSAGSSSFPPPLPPRTGGVPVSTGSASAEQAARQLREAADSGPPNLCALAEAAAEAHPLSIEIQYLHAMALLRERRFEAACVAARRIVYLDASHIIGHFILATALERNGQKAAARRSYIKIEKLCALLPAHEVIPFADGETAAMLRDAARRKLQGEGKA